MSMQHARRGVLVLLALCACRDGADARFQAEVAPLLEARCAGAGCHGEPEGAASDARWFAFPVGADGLISDVPAALAAAKARVNSAEHPELSTLLRKTLPVAAGGLPHFRGAVFGSRDDRDYRLLSSWAALVADGAEGREPELSEREQLFADRIFPELVARGCTTATCHGVLAFGGASLEPPPFGLPASKAALRAAYREAQRNLTSWGDPRRARLLTKMLPLARGGIGHKGGNDAFFAAELEAGIDPLQSPFGKAVLELARAERDAALVSPAPAPPADPPLVFVVGPLALARPFEVPPFTPGTDLYRLDPPYTGLPVNLTAAAHGEPADVRDPAISHDGRRVAFSMRRSPADAHNLYVMELDGSGLRQLTFDEAAAPAGLTRGSFSPVFGPNGGLAPEDGPAPVERLYFSSTRAAERSDVAWVQNADLWAIDLDGRHLERLTHTVAAEVTPSFLTAGEFSGTLAYTIQRSAEAGGRGVVFRFPVDHNRDFHLQPEAHPHFGTSAGARVVYGLRELPDGRAVVALLDANNVWRGGPLALLERQFAVELPQGAEALATVPNFRHALTVLTPEASREGLSPGGLWRDAAPLPDGSVVAAHAPGLVDLADPARPPRTRLVRLGVENDLATGRPRLSSPRALYEHPAASVSQPVPVISRPLEDAPHPRQWAAQGATGTLVHSGVQVNEALFAQLPPAASRPLRSIPAVRLVGALAELEAAPVPAAETRHGHPRATRLSLTGRMPLYVAGELAALADGSLAAHVPARRSLRLVTLGADGLATGAQQPHWYAVQPGERFSLGIAPSSYNARCGGCHGGMDGQRESVLQPLPDVVTQASVTQALYEDGDRRRPRALPTVTPAAAVTVDFRRDVQPILTAKCAGCHFGPLAPAGLSLTAAATAHYTDAYESLLAPGFGSGGGLVYVDADGARARGSSLAERLLGRELEAPRAVSGSCPPAAAPALDGGELKTLLLWLELGATWVGAP
ncbi:MAG: hypothetical protein IPJ65_14395 [Archangiaceae bacterium]|nr:hypothetical protein [Archangiaceae bacterium]